MKLTPALAEATAQISDQILIEGQTGAPAQQEQVTVPTSTSGSQVQQPVPNNIYLMFPGLKAIEDKQALDYLFGLDAH